MLGELPLELLNGLHQKVIHKVICNVLIEILLELLCKKSPQSFCNYSLMMLLEELLA